MSERVGGIYYDVSLDTSQLIGQNRAIQTELDKAAQSFNRITSAVKLLGLAMAAAKLAERADEFRLLQSRVDVAASSVESGAAAFGQLVAISRQTQTSLAGNIEVFTRLNQSIVQMGGNQADTLRLTDLLAKAIKVSGANAVEAKSAMIQFGQALGSGKLAGDELRSLLENAPYLMRQLAEGLGVPIGALKKLGEEGKLTADAVVNALSGAAAKIEADFKTFPQTFAGAMQVLQDSASLAILKFDDLSGSSATMTGLALGASEAFEKLGDEIAATNEKAGDLGRNKAVRTWADESRVALSYLIDAADTVWQTLSVLGRNVAFVFKGIGTEIGGIGAQIAAVARGDFAGASAIGDAMKAGAEARRKELDAADAKTLSRTRLFGQQMREAWDAGAGGGRGFVNPAAAASKLKPPPGSGKTGKEKVKFDAEGYLAGLNTQVVDGIARVDAAEQQALLKNAKLLQEKKITAEQSAQAITLIEQKAADDRLDIQLRNAEGIRAAIEKGGEEEAAARKKLAEDQERGRKLAGDLIIGDDPIAKLQQDLELKSSALAAAAAIDMDNVEFYAQAKVALEEQTAAKMQEIRDKTTAAEQQAASQRLQNYSSLFDSLAGIVQAFGGKQNAAYKVMFAASKAFAIADSVIKIQQAMATAAASGPFPYNLAAMGSVAAATAGLVSTISSTSYGGGRQYGGPVAAGSMYRVNETGRPEMFTAANGSQYMLPTASGDVTPAGGGGGAAWTINVNNAPAGTTATVNNEARIIEIAVKSAEASIAGQIRENSGQVWGAMRGATNVQGRL